MHPVHGRPGLNLEAPGLFCPFEGEKSPGRIFVQRQAAEGIVVEEMHVSSPIGRLGHQACIRVCELNRLFGRVCDRAQIPVRIELKRRPMAIRADNGGRLPVGPAFDGRDIPISVRDSDQKTLCVIIELIEHGSGQSVQGLDVAPIAVEFIEFRAVSGWDIDQITDPQLRHGRTDLADAGIAVVGNIDAPIRPDSYPSIAPGGKLSLGGRSKIS